MTITLKQVPFETLSIFMQFPESVGPKYNALVGITLTLTRYPQKRSESLDNHLYYHFIHNNSRKPESSSHQDPSDLINGSLVHSNLYILTKKLSLFSNIIN